MPTLTLDEWNDVLEPDDGLTPISVSMDGTKGITQFVLPPGWNVGIEGKDGQDVTTAVMGAHGKEYSLTKDAALEIAHSVGIPPKYVMRTPGPLIQSHLNYWATHSPDVDLRLLVKNSTVRVVAKKGIDTWSNVTLLDTVLEALAEFDHTDDIEIDSKSHHSLDLTQTRIIFGGDIMEHKGATSWQHDHWHSGLQLTNSLIGRAPLSVMGYLYNASTDSAIITQNTEGKYNRKTMGQDFGEVVQWLKQATIDLVKSLEVEHETLDHAGEQSIAGDIAPVLADIFKTYKVPLKARQPIMDMLLESEDFTYYGVVNAIAKSASWEGLPVHFVTNLMEIAGDIAKHASERCENCKRVLV